MSATISRRNLLQIAGGTAATFGLSTVAAEGCSGACVRPERACLRSVKDDYKEDFFYREDWLGEPGATRTRSSLFTAMTSRAFNRYGMGPSDVPSSTLTDPDPICQGLGIPRFPAGFSYSLATLATFVAQVMDRAGVECRAHMIGAKTGGAVAMRFAADYPKCTRLLRRRRWSRVAARHR